MAKKPPKNSVSAVTAERAHDHHVTGVGPERLEGSGSSFDQVAQGLLAPGDETVPVAVHG